MARTIAVSGTASGLGLAVRQRLEAAGDRVVGVDLRDAEVLCPSRRPSMQSNRRLAGGLPFDLDLAPADPADPESEHLRHRLFRRPATGHGLRSSAHIGAFGVGQDSGLEPRGMPLQDACDARHTNDVDADGWELWLGRGVAQHALSLPLGQVRRPSRSAAVSGRRRQPP